MTYNPKHEDFDPDRCWDVDCEYCDEMIYEDEDRQLVYDGLACFAPYEFICPLYMQKIKEDLSNYE